MEGGGPADDCPDQDIDHLVDTEAGRVHRADIVGVETARDPCEEGGNDKRERPVAERVDTDGFGEPVLPVDCVESQPDA